MLKILIIDDTTFKSDAIKRALSDRCECEITQKYARNAGLLAVRDAKKNGCEYDIIMCDNYMPIYEGDSNIQPFGADIVRELKRIGAASYVCMCSSEEMPDCGYNWSIQYDYAVYMGDAFDAMLADYANLYSEKASSLKRSIDAIVERARYLEATQMTSAQEPEIGINEETNMITISKYDPSMQAAFHIEDFCPVSSVGLESLRRRLDDENIAYVL